MKTKEEVLEMAKKYIEVVNISDSINSNSIYADKMMFSSSNAIRDHFNEMMVNNNLKLGNLKSGLNDLLGQWNESISIETEIFWEKVQQLNTDLVRKEPLLFLLKYKRFFNVHIGMQAKSNWDKMKSLDSIKRRYSIAEIQLIEELIEKDMNSRLELLRNVLKKKKVPGSSYLRFGDSVAYFFNCSLINTYFNVEEKKELLRLLNSE